MSYWHPDPDYPGWYCRIPLSDGQFLILSAADYDENEVYTLELQVAPGNFDPMAFMDDAEGVEYQCKEGTAVGPGGTEVFGILPGALFHLEYLIAKQGGNPILSARAATLKLHRIYENFLTRRGYTSVAGTLLKELHWKNTERNTEV